MQASTTSSYSVWATSDFATHSGGLAALQIATSIISSVSNPCEYHFPTCACVPEGLKSDVTWSAVIAKLCDIFTRPYMYLMSMLWCVVPPTRVPPFSPFHGLGQDLTIALHASLVNHHLKSYTFGFVMILKVLVSLAYSRNRKPRSVDRKH